MGSECPMCDAKLTGRKCRECGWAMADPTVMPTHNTCEGCGDASSKVSPFHPDADDGAAPPDRGKRLCPSCWVPALRRRYELDPITAEGRAACMKKILAYTEIHIPLPLFDGTRGA